MDYISYIKTYIEQFAHNRYWRSKLTKLLNKTPGYTEFKQKEFNFLSNPTDIQIFWHVLNDDRKIHTCCNCNKPVKFDRQVNYRKLCSKKCTAIYTAKNMSDEDKDKIVKKREMTSVERYGEKYASQTKECKDKTKQTCLDKYGTEYPMQNTKIHDKQFKAMQNTNLERYGTKSTLGLDETRENYKKTMVERYGVEHGFHNPNIYEKMKTTTKKRYGVEYYSKSKDWYKRYKKHEWGNKYKDYITPTGTILRIQGYENFALDKLFETQQEDNILVNKIISEIGKIEYVFDGETKLYNPDIYLKKENKIIEVKSQFTYNVQIEKNKLKAKACLDLGFQFEFWIIDRKGNIKIMQPDIS